MAKVIACEAPARSDPLDRTSGELNLIDSVNGHR
jgi:hypothetical protein